jgi:formylglycine-generating enzyme required for sulfatase activity
MVHVPGGTFMMGCVDGDTQCDNNEKPRHQVMLSSFYLDIHEVTAAEYAQCVNAGACTSPGTDDFWAEFYNWNKPGRENHPVNGVRWYNADTYCRWQNKRLPTEAEFEYALRGGNDGYVYPWGNNRTPPARFGNYGDESLHRRFPSIPYFAGYDDGYVGTSPVCKFARNAYGLCDMSGNVREWVSDWDDDNYYQSSPNHDPQGPSSGLFRVFRGVGWKLVDPGYVRVSYRGPGGPYDQDSDLGFRCARN